MLSRCSTVFICTGLALCLLLSAVYADDTAMGPRKFGIGMQAAPFPVFGVALTVHPSSRLGLQAIGRVGIDVDFFAVRALARVKSERNYSVYFSGILGTFKDDDVSVGPLADYEEDTGPGFGVGAGFEYFFSGLPAVGWNLEVDYLRIGFEDKWWEYDYETPQLIMLGAGINFYF
jgi:hypothetical protein